jgi:hypothetical protein
LGLGTGRARCRSRMWKSRTANRVHPDEGGKLKAFSFWERHGTNSTWEPLASVTEGKQWLRKPISLLSTSMSRTAERLDLEKHARLEAGLIDPVIAIQLAPTAEQHREGLSFWQAVKTMFR